MKVKFKKNIGNSEFEFEIEAESQKDFIQQVSFLAQLPEEGPNGEKDLALVHRMTKDNDSYYSVVCKSAGQELAIGQYKSPKGKDELFLKGWQPLWNPNSASSDAGSIDGLDDGLSNTPTPVAKPKSKAVAPKVATINKPSISSKVSAPKVSAPTPAEMVEESSDDSEAQDILKQFIGG